MSKRYKLSLKDYSSGFVSTGAVLATAAAVLGSNLVVVALAWDNPPAAGGDGYNYFSYDDILCGFY